MTVNGGGMGAATTIVFCVVTRYGTALESVSCAVNVYVPTLVGVPVTAPVVGLNVKPGGTAPAV